MLIEVFIKKKLGILSILLQIFRNLSLKMTSGYCLDVHMNQLKRKIGIFRERKNPERIYIYLSKFLIGFELWRNYISYGLNKY